ncbi:MAG TPA: EscU/YscU/HrcU family type III secretion system export apparatus switch protein [Polyangiales bacterium]
MAENRTEQASARRLARARARGDVVVSRELISAALIGAICLGATSITRFWLALEALTRDALSGHTPSRARAVELLSPFGLLLASLPVAAFAAAMAQRGLALTFPRANSEAGSIGRRLADAFGPEAWHRFAVASLKLAAISCVLALALSGSLPGVLTAFERDPREVASLSFELARSLLVRAALALLAIGALDWSYLRFRRARRLRMTRRESIEERRASEGDPSLGQRRRQSWALLAHASLADLASAAIVIRGATRAVALRFRSDDALPTLWIKADGALAEAMIVRASALGLPIASDEGLAQLLSPLEPTEAIPAHAYDAVALQLTAAGIARP